MKRIDQDNYELSTGRQFYANNGEIGRGCDAQANPSHGGDGSISVADPLACIGDGDESWTPAECAELADAMIARWQTWKGAHA